MTIITDANDFPEFAHLNAKTCSHGEASDRDLEEDGEDCINFSHEELADCLLNRSGKVSLPERFRALFALKYLGDESAINIIGQGTFSYSKKH